MFELAFHPTTNLLAAGLVTGEVDLYAAGWVEHRGRGSAVCGHSADGGGGVAWSRVRFTDEGNLLVAALTHHKESCRAVQFSALGTGTSPGVVTG